ncbi:hypothetical protein H6G27_29640 [Nostoc linckia FACHB-104]|nr:hypothetical protein [Nostoc linckia FACHB-104]
MHNWLCLNSEANSTFLNIEAFQQWFETEIGQQLTTAQISSAIAELERHDLIKILSWEIEPREMDLDKFHPKI